MAFIYILTNKLNGKQYVGKTEVSVKYRLQRHMTEMRKPTFKGVLHNAIRKYSIDSFEIECFEVSNSFIDLWEKHLIKKWNTKAPNGYNLTDGGDGCCGHKHTEEWKRQASLRNRGKNNAMYGRNLSKKTREAISIGNKGKVVSNKTKKLISLNNWQRRGIIIIEPDGNEYIFSSITDAAKHFNTKGCYFSRVASGERKHHRGLKVRYVE